MFFEGLLSICFAFRFSMAAVASAAPSTAFAAFAALLSGNLPQFTDYLGRVHFPSVSVSLTVDFCSPVCVCLCVCMCVSLMTMARTKI